MNNEHWSEVDDHSDTWDKIAMWYTSLPRPLANAYQGFFEHEMVREAKAKRAGTQKANLAWEARTYHCPAISKWLCDHVGNENPYACELLNYDPEGDPCEDDGSKTIYDFTVIGLISDNLTERKSAWRAFPPAVMAAIIRSDGKWAKNFHQGEDGPDAWDLLPDDEISHHYDLWLDGFALGDVFKQMSKHFVVIKNGKNPIVMGRMTYDFLTYYAVTVKGVDIRIPSLLAPEVENTPVKIPQVLKNFRFDFTNARALDEAADITGEKYVNLLDRLLKKYLGLIVAEVLVEQVDSTMGNERAREINQGEAKADLETFAKSVRNFGFNVPDSLDEVGNDYVADHNRLSMELASARQEAAMHKAAYEELKKSADVRLELKSQIPSLGQTWVADNPLKFGVGGNPLGNPLGQDKLVIGDPPPKLTITPQGKVEMSEAVKAAIQESVERSLSNIMIDEKGKLVGFADPASVKIDEPAKSKAKSKKKK